MIQLSDRQRFALAVLLLLFIPTVIGVYGPERLTPVLESKWERFILLTLCLLSLLVKAYWKIRTDQRFWSILLGFTILHVTGLGYFFWFGNGLPFPIFELACAGEVFAVGVALYWVLGVSPASVNSNR